MILDKYFYGLKFFTTWTLILAVLHRYTMDYVDLIFLTFVTAIIGMYFSFIKPRKFVFYFDGIRYEYTGVQKFIIVDMIFHLLIFFLIYNAYKNYYHKMDFRTFNAILLMIIYATFTNFKKLYGVELNEIIFVFIIAVLLYYLIFHRK